MKSTTTRRTARTNGKALAAAPVGIPTVEEVSARAYDLYLARGGADGHAVEDWLAAEQELLDLHARVARFDAAEV